MAFLLLPLDLQSLCISCLTTNEIFCLLRVLCKDMAQSVLYALQRIRTFAPTTKNPRDSTMAIDIGIPLVLQNCRVLDLTHCRMPSNDAINRSIAALCSVEILLLHSMESGHTSLGRMLVNAAAVANRTAELRVLHAPVILEENGGVISQFEGADGDDFAHTYPRLEALFVEASATVAETLTKSLLNLKALRIDSWGMRGSFSYFRDPTTPKLTRLTHLVFVEYCNIDDATLDAVAQFAPALVYLNIAGDHAYTVVGIRALIRLTQLETLIANQNSGVERSEDCVAELARPIYFPKLVSLVLDPPPEELEINGVDDLVRARPAGVVQFTFQPQVLDFKKFCELAGVQW